MFYRPFLFLLCYYWITMQSSVPSPVPSLEQEAANGARKEATTIQQMRQQEEYDGGGCGYRNDCCASCLSVMMMRGVVVRTTIIVLLSKARVNVRKIVVYTQAHIPSGRGTSARGMCQSERVWWNPLLDYHHHSETTIMSVVGGLQRNCGDVHFICASHSVITVIVSHPPQELWVASCIPPSLYVHGWK